MRNNEERNTYRSSTQAQDKLDQLRSHADSLFSLGWLRKMMWDELTTLVNPKSSYLEFAEKNHSRNEVRFMTMFMSVYQSAVEEVKYNFTHPYLDEDPLVTLFKERQELLERYAQMPLSNGWGHVYRDKHGESWKRFASRLHFDHGEREIELWQFLLLLDKICVITDILNRDERCYGLEPNYVIYKRYRHAGAREEAFDEDMAKRVISLCGEYFYAQTSWAVVYVFCTEDMNMKKSRADFERWVESWRKDYDQLTYACPKGTIDSAFAQSKWLKEPSADWHLYPIKDGVMKLLNELRNSLAMVERAKWMEENSQFSQQK